MQDQQTDTPPLDDAVLALAEAQAAKDRALMAALAERKEAGEEPTLPEPEPEPVIVLNRAQRRQQVRAYARILTLTNRQEPKVNPTIVPKAKRRRRPGQHGRLQHAH